MLAYRSTVPDDAPRPRVTPRTIRRALILATLTLAALCGAVVAVAGPGGYAQFAGCMAVGLAAVALWRRGRG